jgi:glycosyltransferase involved in cell wall biosynthesis
MISIIVPIYNSSKYLSQLIESILYQTYKDYELLLIDDGSIDSSAEICLEYANLDIRIKYYKKCNSGVSSTRNFGLKVAKGRWLMFIDSDDYLLDFDTLQKCMEIVETNGSCIPAFNFKYLIGNKFKNARSFKYNCINNIDIYQNLIGGKVKEYYGEMFRAVWGKMFDKNIIDKYQIKFNENMYIGEDAIFLLDYFKYNSNIKFIDEPLYCYRYYDSSAVRKYKSDLLDQDYQQLKCLLERVDISNSSIRVSLSAFILNEYWNLISNSKKSNLKPYYIDADNWLSENYKYLKGIKFKMKQIGKRNYIYIYIYRFTKKIQYLFTRILCK